jgi:RNA polymerase sigma factor (sigma-70 family)
MPPPYIRAALAAGTRPTISAIVKMMEEPLGTWFKREVLSHEAALVRYLARVWPRRDDLSDLRQETYARVYEAASTARPQSARAFLFSTAHNLVLDRIRRERVVSIDAVADIDRLNVLVEEISPEQCAIGREQLKLLGRAFELLPRKCGEVMWLRRVQDIPQREVARRLKISERTVERHVSKGARLLAKYMLSGGEANTELQQQHNLTVVEEREQR